MNIGEHINVFSTHALAREATSNSLCQFGLVATDVYAPAWSIYKMTT